MAKYWHIGQSRMTNNNILKISDYKHLKKTAPSGRRTKLSQAQIENKIYDTIIKASGLPDFSENIEYYQWYASVYCFSGACELRDLSVEKKLMSSNPSMQLPY